MARFERRCRRCDALLEHLSWRCEHCGRPIWPWTIRFRRSTGQRPNPARRDDEPRRIGRWE